MELFVLGIVAGLSFLSYALWWRSRTASLDEALEQERAAARLASAEPSLHSLRPGDVVCHLGTDYLVEGVLSLDDAGRVTRLYRIADGAAVRWLAVRPGTAPPLVLDEVRGLSLGGDLSAPDELVHSGTAYRLATRTSTHVDQSGILGAFGSGPGDRTSAPERAWLYEYVASGARRLLALTWSGHAEAFAGEPVPARTLELLPGA